LAGRWAVPRPAARAAAFPAARTTSGNAATEDQVIAAMSVAAYVPTIGIVIAAAARLRGRDHRVRSNREPVPGRGSKVTSSGEDLESCVAI
jgi:hypothetical protein